MVLSGLRQSSAVPASTKNGLTDVWHSKSPFRTKAFRWRCIMDILPSKASLAYRGVNMDLNCVLCIAEVEDSFHLFFGCGFIRLIWLEVSCWLGMNCSL